MAVLLAFASGCASSSIKSDEQRVRELVRASHGGGHASFARVAERDVDEGLDAEAKKLLSQPLNADRAARIALLQNRELRAALRDMGVTRGQVLQAGLWPNPHVEVELMPEPDAELELRVEYGVMDAILAPMRARAAAPLIDAARYEAAGAVVELGYRARAAFYALQAAEQRAAIGEQMRAALAASLEATRAMRAAGNVPQLALAQEELAHERAVVALEEVQLQVVLERERFARVLGVERAENDPPLVLEAALAPVPHEPEAHTGLSARALEASFELQALRHRLESLERQAGVARAAGWLPDLDVGLIAARSEDEDFHFGGVLNVGVPLFDRDQGSATALEAERDALLERYYGLVADVRASARMATARLGSAHTRALRYQRSIVPAQEKLAAESLLHYNAMQIGVLDLLRALRDRLDVQLSYTETQREYWSERAALHALIAGRRVADEGQAPRAARSMSTGTEGHGRAGGH